MKTFALSLVLLAGTTACGQTNTPAPKAAAPATSAAAPVKFVAEDVVENVEVPWAIVFDPAGRMLFTERKAATVRVYENGKLQEQPYYKVPNVLTASETGLMGLCLHPDYANNKFVYLSFGYVKDDTRDVRVVRYKDTGSTLQEDKVILSGVAVRSNHSGCSIKFGPDGKLYISTGEMFQQDLAQDMNSLNGKILRVNDDGTVPTDNPFVATEGARPEIWALGVRNPQGFDWQPGTGRMFETEHGPSGERGIGSNNSGGDEFNMIERGKNYGWPIIHHDMKKEGLESPLIFWSRPTMAPGGGCFYNGDKFPALKGNYLVGCLLGGQMRRIVLDGDKVVSDETFLKDYGRIRAVTQGPDGYLYFSTSNKDGRGRAKSNDDRIVRLKPQ